MNKHNVTIEPVQNGYIIRVAGYDTGRTGYPGQTYVAKNTDEMSVVLREIYKEV